MLSPHPPARRRSLPTPETPIGHKTGLQTEGAQGFAALTRHVARIPRLDASPSVTHPTSITTPLAPSPRPPCAAISKRRSFEGNEGPRFSQDHVRRMQRGQTEGACLHHLLQEPQA